MGIIMSRSSVSPQESAQRRNRVSQTLLFLETVVVVAALAVIAGCLYVFWVLVTNPERGEVWTSGLHPAHFYRELDADLLDDYANTFVVGHNSGDGVDTALQALSYGADVIEVDVVAMNGQLYAAHDAPATWIGDNFFRGPPLERIWVATGGAYAIKLDLKESSPAFTELVLDFLAKRRGQRHVIVVSGDPAVLRQIGEREPAVFRLLSVGSERRFEAVVENPALVDGLDGVSIRESLITGERMDWLADHHLLTFAWTVNDLKRVNDLVLLGVDAITTDNLAIMRLLGGRIGEEPRLERKPAAQPSPTSSAATSETSDWLARARNPL
jgi:glycerophosphoryl diester phosphodiesterase